jgi:hypothetical protein
MTPHTHFLHEAQTILGGLLLALLVIAAAIILGRAIEAAEKKGYLTPAERAIAQVAASIFLALDFAKVLVIVWQAGGPA